MQLLFLEKNEIIIDKHLIARGLDLVGARVPAAQGLVWPAHNFKS